LQLLSPLARYNLVVDLVVELQHHPAVLWGVEMGSVLVVSEGRPHRSKK
jgi:hypothetical protein